jgi:hypothetical protein
VVVFLLGRQALPPTILSKAPRRHALAAESARRQRKVGTMLGMLERRDYSDLEWPPLYCNWPSGTLHKPRIPQAEVAGVAAC